MKPLLLFLLAANTLHFDVTDTRGKHVSGVVFETGEADTNGWRELHLVKSKPGVLVIWPYDARVKQADGPAPIPVVVSEAGDANLRGNAKAAAAAFLRGDTDIAFDTEAFIRSGDNFTKGVGLLVSGKASDAAEPLSLALRDRERQLTRIPSETYPAAILAGRALLAAGKYDDAAVAFLKALKQRPGDDSAIKYRAEALTRAGKPGAY